MSEDARVRYTKMMIQKSFIKLLNEKPLSKIKLKEVCELAGINRSTYYKYYQDTYDWFEQIECECLKWANIYMDQISTTDIKLVIVNMLQAIKDNWELFNAIFASQNNDIFIKNILSMYIEKINNKFENNSWDCAFLIYGLNGIVNKWIKEDMQTPVENVADYMIEKIHNTLKK